MATARAFLEFLDQRGGASGESSDQAKPSLSADVEALACDLLGATLVDAQDELRKAIEEVDEAGSPPGAAPLLTPLPPWPPASVEKLLRKGGEESATLIETLTAQLAPSRGLGFGCRKAGCGLENRSTRISFQSWPKSSKASSRASPGSALASGRVDAVGAPAVSLGGPTGGLAFSSCHIHSIERAMIRVIAEGLVKRYGPLAAVDHASLELPPGELTCLLGPSGAGKSTFARLLAGLESVDDGEIYFGERMVQGVAPGERGVGMVFQDHALWPAISIRDNVGYPLKLQGLSSIERRRAGRGES